MGIPESLLDSLNGILIFEVDDKEFCVNNKFISEIVTPGDIFMNSGAANLVFEYTDMILKIIDSENFLSDEIKKPSPLSRILMFDINDKTFGLLVDNVKEIVAVDSHFMEKFIAILPAEEDGYITAILKFEGRMIKFLDIEKISKERVDVK